MRLRIDKEFERLIPPLSKDELIGLELSLKSEGCRHPLIAWGNVLVDGHNRYRLCKKNRIKFEVQQKEFADKEEAIQWMISHQLNERRNLTAEGISYLRGKHYDMLKQRQGRPKKRDQNEPFNAKTYDMLAKQYRVHANTIKRDHKFYLAAERLVGLMGGGTLEKILSRDQQITRKDVITLAGADAKEEKAGKTKAVRKKEAGRIVRLVADKKVKNVASAVKSEATQAAADEARRIEIPKGLYRVIVADPPWSYDARGDDESHRARCVYPTMSVEQICEVPVADHAYKDCILWLWTTNAFMYQAYEVAESWGFEVKTILTWVKDKMGLGDWLRGKTEHCLMCVKGKPPIKLTNQTTVIEGPLREHSRKPDEFFRMIEKLCPAKAGQRLEMYSRQKRKGWTTFGAESEKFDGEI